MTRYRGNPGQNPFVAAHGHGKVPDSLLFSSPLFSFSFFVAHGCAAQNWSHSGVHRDRRCDCFFFGPAFSTIDTYVISLHPLPFLVCNLISGQEGGGGGWTLQSPFYVLCDIRNPPCSVRFLNCKVSRRDGSRQIHCCPPEFGAFWRGLPERFFGLVRSRQSLGLPHLASEQTTILTADVSSKTQRGRSL